MDDELEDKVFYQAYVSHMKVLSKFAVGFSSINSPLAYTWKLCRLYVLRPEVIFCGVILFILLVYLQAVDVWSRGILGRLQATLGRQKSHLKSLNALNNGDYQCWEEVKQQSAAFAVLGRRPRMEDRYIIEENINGNTGISFFAVFDGHGGEFAADFAKDILVKNIYNKVIETTKLLSDRKRAAETENDQDGSDYTDYDASPYLRRRSSRAEQANKENAEHARRRDSLRKTHSVTDDCATAQKSPANQRKEIDVFTSKLNSLMRGSGVGKSARDDFFNNNKDIGAQPPPPVFDAKCYIENGKINFGKMITDEVLAADYKLVETAKKTTNIAGTTALIAIMQSSQLIVANVGDSRGVMCDSRGIAIPLSFDHKPQQVRERKRIHDAGGFIAFRGVWRVAGILATSRALGDYPLKDKNLVIANPDILTFDLNDHKPTFLILASDGLWDTFNNEEACSFIKAHIRDKDYGAKALAMESYNRGSVDNITVLVIVFRNGLYRIGTNMQKGSEEGGAAVEVVAAAGGRVPLSANVSRSASLREVKSLSSHRVHAAPAILRRSNSAISTK